VTQREEATAALGHLLDRPDAGDAMGRAGRAFVLRNYHEDRQREDLRGLIDYLQLDDRSRLLSQVPGTSQGEQIRQDFCDKVGRKFRTWRIIRR